MLIERGGGPGLVSGRRYRSHSCRHRAGREVIASGSAHYQTVSGSVLRYFCDYGPSDRSWQPATVAATANCCSFTSMDSISVMSSRSLAPEVDTLFGAFYDPPTIACSAIEQVGIPSRVRFGPESVGGGCPGGLSSRPPVGSVLKTGEGGSPCKTRLVETSNKRSMGSRTVLCSNR